MDKRISLLNILKNKLSKQIANGSKQSKPNLTYRTQSTSLSNIRALLLSENVHIGLAIDEKSLEKSEIYSEMNVNGGLKFHIYPQNLKELQESREETTKKRTNSAILQY
jgi:hypothetical protein